MNRQQLKLEARRFMDEGQPKPLNAGLLYLLLSVVIALLSAKIMGGGITEANLTQYTQHILDGNFDYAVEYLERIRPPFSAYAVEMLLRIMLRVVSVGFLIFLMNTVRRAEAGYGNLLDGFGSFLRIIILDLLQGIFVALLSLLLVVPGIIAVYAYSQATYLLIDHPEYSPFRCLRESRRMMKGHKWEYFVLRLSFLGWEILGMFPLIGYFVRVFTTPYFGLTYTLYYDQLRSAEPVDETAIY